jgi:hypothetical protein
MKSSKKHMSYCTSLYIQFLNNSREPRIWTWYTIIISLESFEEYCGLAAEPATNCETLIMRIFLLSCNSRITAISDLQTL